MRRQPREQIEVTQNEGRFGDDRDGVVGAIEHFEDGTREPMLALDRLIGVGDGTERDDLGNIARSTQFAFEQCGGVDLGVEFGFEIEAGGMAKIAMRGTREAIDAAVLATPIGVDRLLEADVGAVVTGDDALGRLAVNLGLERGKVAQALPAVVERLASFMFKPANLVGARAPPASAFGIDERLRGRWRWPLFAQPRLV